MIRGDIVTAASGSGYGGKPRPVLIVQNDDLADRPTLIVVGFTATIDSTSAWRIIIEPDETNGLREASALMTDTPYIVLRNDVGKLVGRLSAYDLARLDFALMFVLGLT